jgi:hypothetical protein
MFHFCHRGTPLSFLPAPILAIDASIVQGYFCAPRSFTHAKGRPKKRPATATNELEHQIRLRAYELYEARGRRDGHELEDWFRAKEEIAIKKFRTATA